MKPKKTISYVVGIAGTSALANNGYAAGIISLIVAAFTALLTFLNPEERKSIS